MSEFKREARYYVIKIKNLSEDQDIALCDLLSGLRIPCTDCVVVEKDWRNYEHTWKTIEQVASGAFTDPYAEIEGLNERISQQQSDNEQLRERVAQLTELVAEACGLFEGILDGSYCPDSFTSQPYRIALESDNSRSWLLRKEASAVEAAADKYGNIGDSPFRHDLMLTLKDHAQRLRQQADKQEK